MPSLPELVSSRVAPRAERFVGLSVAAVRGEHTELRQSGRRDESGDPVEADSIFEIGSVTKVFTSLLLAEMVVRGEVTLDDPLADSYPELDLPVRGRPVTLRDLASHTGGFPRLPAGLFRRAFRHGDNPYARFTDADVATALEHLRLGEPGGRIRYSNFGAAVLGQALARRHCTSYGVLLAERVTGPLGLADTRVEVADETRRAVGHGRRGRPVPDWDMPALPGMGALHSTAPDLARFARVQLDPSACPLEDAVRLSQQVHAGEGARLSVGLGWMITPSSRTGHTMLWHNGGTGGARSMVALVPDRDAAVVALTNCVRSTDTLAVDLLEDLVSPGS